MFKLPDARSTGSIALTFLLGVAPISLGVVACSTTQPVKTQVSDASITSSVKARFAADPTVKMHNIDVVTQEGVVILSGRVNTATERDEAERLARKVDGVKGVTNLLKVGDKTP